MRNLPIISLSFLVLACGLAYSALYGTSYQPAVKFPINLKVGTTRSPEFYAKRNTEYEIVLALYKLEAVNEPDCKLGAPIIHQVCEKKKSPISLNWRLYRDNALDSQGSSSPDQGGGWAKDYMERVIGRTKLASGKSYYLEVESIKNASILNAAEPYILLNVSAFDAKGSGISELVWALVLGIAGIIGVIIRFFDK